MIIASLELTLYAPWVHSLKEKRSVVKSIVQKTQQHFHVAAAEVKFQDLHQSIGVAFAIACNTAQQADSMLDHIIAYVEANTEAEITEIERIVY